MYEFSKKEKETLKFWQENKIFEKSLEQNKNKKEFVFYDGPPFATGTPHYGHLLQSAIKDAIPRYKTMQGFYVERQWGWDCHGLPIENIVEKNLGTKNKKEIMAMGVKKFNDLCRQQLFTVINEWEEVIPRFGRWADMAHPYRTMDFEYMQKEWWAFKELHKKGLIYEAYKSMHICPRCETTLSQGEVAEGYKDIKDLSATLKFKIKNPEKHGLPENTYFLAWTTTPWTLPGNVALAVGEKMKYVLVEYQCAKFVLAKERLENVFAGKEYKIEKECLGKNLVGLEYEPLFDNYIKVGKVVAADFVTTEDGTGIVHIAHAFGADDMELGKKENLPFVQHVKPDGTFKEEMGKFSGLDLKPRAKNKPEEIREADLTINKYLDKKGLLFAYDKYEHSYPHCWRCDTALLNYATSSWFVAVEKIKPLLLKNAKKINWSPAHIKEGRFGQWLEGARDWSISRQRFWANTIPIWICDKCKKQMVFGSAEELEKASGQKVNDLHKDIVDEIVFSCSCGGKMRRVPDVLDTWFDSGSMAFATNRPIPADFIGEAQDQTRAWFYYMHVLSGALFNKEAFKNCIVTGIVLAEDGKKMSKKLKNYPDPKKMLEKYGADAMRFYMMSSPVVQAENLSFSEKGIAEIANKNIGRLYNVLAFYNLYKDGTLASDKSKNLLDAWIIARLNEVGFLCESGYENYRIDLATRPLTDFIDDFSVWYLRRSRERFKEESTDKKDALATLRFILEKIALIMAPVMPFFAEEVFSVVKSKSDKESVHLMPWPKFIVKKLDIIIKMHEVKSIVNLILGERMAVGIKVKQPLSSVKIQGSKFKIEKDKELLKLIKDETNIKEIIFDNRMSDLIFLDTNITEELKEEGIIREIVRAVQAERKNQNLIPQDKIFAELLLPKKEKEAVEKNKEFLLKEIRAVDILIRSADKLEIKIKKIK
jgi:isoleucyl-tRNA synthetase